jgi:tetratricopeptide (TPR) repeat protein
MKKSVVLFISLIVSTCLSFMGCSGAIEYEPDSSVTLINRLPKMTSTVDYISIYDSYTANPYYETGRLLGFRDGDGSATWGPNSMVYYYWKEKGRFNYFLWRNLTEDVFCQDVEKNICNNSTENEGCVVLKIKKHKVVSSIGLWGHLALVSCWTFPLLGAPIEECNGELQIELEIRNLKGERIASYIGNANTTIYEGFYYRARGGAEETNKELLNQAMDDIKQKMSNDAAFITDSLNRCYEEVKHERQFAIQQSVIISDELAKADSSFNLGDYKTALEYYTAVLQRYPFHTPALFNRGKAKFFTGLYHQALNDFNLMLEYAPDNYEAYFQRGGSKSCVK